MFSRMPVAPSTLSSSSGLAIACFAAGVLHGGAPVLDGWLDLYRDTVLLKIAGLDAWTAFGPEHLTAAAELAGLPSAAEQDADEAARRFDALVLTAQVAVAEGEPVRAGILSRLLGIVRALADQRSIPAVAAHAALLDAAAAARMAECAGRTSPCTKCRFAPGTGGSDLLENTQVGWV